MQDMYEDPFEFGFHHSRSGILTAIYYTPNEDRADPEADKLWERAQKYSDQYLAAFSKALPNFDPKKAGLIQISTVFGQMHMQYSSVVKRSGWNQLIMANSFSQAYGTTSFGAVDGLSHIAILLAIYFRCVSIQQTTHGTWDWVPVT